MIAPDFSLFGVTLHWYGVFIAVAIGVVYVLAEKRTQRVGILPDAFSQIATRVLILGCIGARLWHVATDWSLYASDPLSALYIWQGGLSMFGGILGGAVGLWRQPQFFRLSDSIVLVLPIGQAIGRLGNWVNQELYGLPTNLPWKIFIAPEHRLPGFEQVAYYHPLFAYEAVTLLIFTVLLWQLEKRQPKIWNIGSGRVTITYILFYCVLRFFLDFIRPDKQVFWITGLGVNQVIVALVAVGLSSVLFLRKTKS